MTNNTAKQYNPAHSLLSLFPFPHLMPHHLTDNGRTEATLIIDSIEPQDVEVEPGIFEEKPVINFKKTELGFVLNGRHDLQTLTEVYGINTIGDAPNKNITIALINNGEGETLMVVPPNTKKVTPKSNKPAGTSKPNDAAGDTDTTGTTGTTDTTDDTVAQEEAEPPTA